VVSIRVDIYKVISKLPREEGSEHTRTREKLLHDFLPACGQQLICLIDDSVFEATEGQQVEVLHEVHKATRSGNENVTAHLKLFTLVARRRSTVDHTRAQHRTVAQATSLVKDLTGQLPSWAYDKNKRFCANAVCQLVVSRRVWTRSGELASFAHESGQDGDEEGSRLSGTW
jgi:hypothetical protein